MKWSKISWLKSFFFKRCPPKYLNLNRYGTTILFFQEREMERRREVCEWEGWVRVREVMWTSLMWRLIYRGVVLVRMLPTLDWSDCIKWYGGSGTGLGCVDYVQLLKLYWCFNCINLNIDTPIDSRSDTHSPHSQTSRLFSSSLSLGIPFPLSTQCVIGLQILQF